MRVAVVVYSMTRPANSLPDRAGARPRTTPSNPHSQLDQHSSPEVLSELTRALFALPHVREAPGAISVPGARGLWLEPGQGTRSPRGVLEVVLQLIGEALAFALGTYENGPTAF